MAQRDEKTLQAKHNQYLKRQKHYLNEKLIFNHFFVREFEREKTCSGFEEYFTKRMHNEKDIELLDMNQKYDVVHTELQSAHEKWEDFERKKDDKTDELLAQNQEVINHIKDIKMEVYELNRKIDSQSEHKNGKISDEVFKKFFEDKFKKLDNLKKKYKEQVENLNKQIAIKTNKLRNKDSNNELQFIDFHQLQIENKKYVKEVDEKNKLLLKLKMTIGKITQDKNNFKNKLNAELAELAKYKGNNRKHDLDIEKYKKMNARQKQLADKRKTDTNKLNNKLSKGGVLEINHHIREKNIEKELVHILDNLTKKLEIEQIKEKGNH